MQHELERELTRLQTDYGRGKELRVRWEPKTKVQKAPYGKTVEIRGEVLREEHTINIYDINLTEALHTLRHEFIEYILDFEIVGPYVGIYNEMIHAMEQAFMENQYLRKEAIIEILVSLEEKRIRGEKK